MSTIRDVAKRAGVSPMTVSRVINRSGYISQETRERVESAIAEIGYIPNTLARSLRFKKTKMLALILTDITNPFFTTLARGVQDAASAQGFSVILCNTDESEAEQAEHLTALVQKRVDGVLLVPASNSAEPVTFLRDQKVPVVVLDRRVPDCSVDSVRCDSEGGAYELIRLLIQLGHRRIAVLSGPENVSTAQERVAGCRRALAEAGIELDPELVFHDAYSHAGGRRMAQRMLAIQPRPTAVFATNNFIAMGAYAVLVEAGLSVPRDVAMVAFDDWPPGMVVDPFFTVVAQPAYEMGYKATVRLLSRLSGETVGSGQEMVLPFDLLVRRSSGSPQECDSAQAELQ